jgi:hypothetical protein
MSKTATFRILAASLAATSLFACNGSDSNAPASSAQPQAQQQADSSAQFFPLFAGTQLNSANDSLLFANDGTFQLTVNVRLEPHSASNLAKSTYVDSDCSIRLQGSSRYLTNVASADGLVNQLSLTVSNITVVSAYDESAALDSSDAAASSTCDDYAGTLLKQSNFALGVQGYSANYIALASFQLPDALNTVGNDGTSFDVFEMQFLGGGSQFRYFVRSGSKVDITQQVLSGAAGAFTDEDPGEQVSAVVDSQQKEISLKDPCGNRLVLNISSVLADGSNMIINAASSFFPGPGSAASSAESSSSQCSALNEINQAVQANALSFNYSTNKCDSSAAECFGAVKTMVFGHAPDRAHNPDGFLIVQLTSAPGSTF